MKQDHAAHPHQVGDLGGDIERLRAIDDARIQRHPLGTLQLDMRFACKAQHVALARLHCVEQGLQAAGARARYHVALFPRAFGSGFADRVDRQ